MCIVLPLGYSPLTLSSTVIHFVCASPVGYVARRLTAHTVHYHIIIILLLLLLNITRLGRELGHGKERIRNKTLPRSFPVASRNFLDAALTNVLT